MTGFDEGFAGDGEPGPRTGPFFPGPSGRQGTVPPPGMPLPAPPAPAAPPSVTSSGANVLPMTLHGSPGDISTGVDGRITIENGVIGKIAALAALEVGGVAALIPKAGMDAAGTGVRVDVDEAADEVTLDVAIAVEYGSVVKDVARVVKTNVARVTGLMLGTRVAAVHVTVQDVRVPDGHATGRA